MNGQQATGDGPFEFQASAFGLYVGLMSGTSMDGIDAGVFEIAGGRLKTVATRFEPYDEDLRSDLTELVVRPEAVGLDRLGELDTRVGERFAAAVLALLEESSLTPGQIVAIGSHGQTVRHRPDLSRPFTMQIGDPNIIAARTGTVTVADFRRKDVALGGQGAPLTSAFHRAAFGSREQNLAIVNIGGIANVTVLASDGGTSGFDTGPGNVLMDLWTSRCRNKLMDEEGRWAATGNVDPGLLEKLLEDPYFQRQPPKSTGREAFNLAWLDSRLARLDEQPVEADVQTTLCQLTARTVADAIAAFAVQTDTLVLCGGGSKNTELVRRLAAAVAPLEITGSEAYGLDPEWVEAAAFAWFASMTLRNQVSSIPEVTGASRPAVLGAIYPS